MASLTLEPLAYYAANELAMASSSATRREQLVWLGRAAAAAYGMGLLKNFVEYC